MAGVCWERGIGCRPARGPLGQQTPGSESPAASSDTHFSLSGLWSLQTTHRVHTVTSTHTSYTSSVQQEEGERWYPERKGLPAIQARTVL